MAEEPFVYFLFKFQFLYGAIKSLLLKQVQLLLMQFQFLYGAIKSQYIQLTPVVQNRFNSSIVRLKEFIERKIRAYY